MAEHCFLSQNVPSRILADVLMYDIHRYDNLVTNLTTSRHNPSWVVADSSELNFVVNFEKQIFKRKKNDTDKVGSSCRWHYFTSVIKFASRSYVYF